MIKRRGHETMAMMPASEIEGLLETAHLLRSPKNARRLLEALGQALRGEGEAFKLEELRHHIGLE